MGISAMLVGLVAGAALALASTPAGHAQGKDLPKPDAEALWKYLEKQDYQKNFRLFPGKGKMYKGTQPHGAFLSTYVNPPAHKALAEGDGPLPAGSILVKENYMPDKKLAAVTVMYKVAGYDAKNNDWFWLKRTADGKVEASGKVDSCIACHTDSKRDFILTPVKK